MSGSNKWSLKSGIPCVLEFWVLFSANRSRRKKEEVKMCRRKTLCSRNGAPEASPNWEGSGVDSKVRCIRVTLQKGTHSTQNGGEGPHLPLLPWVARQGAGNATEEMAGYPGRRWESRLEERGEGLGEFVWLTRRTAETLRAWTG